MTITSLIHKPPWFLVFGLAFYWTQTEEQTTGEACIILTQTKEQRGLEESQQLPIKIEIAPLEGSLTNSVTFSWERGSTEIFTRSTSDPIYGSCWLICQPPLIGGITAISSPCLSSTRWSAVMYSWFTARITLALMEERLKEVGNRSYNFMKM